MKHLSEEWVVYHNDLLVKRWINSKTRATVSQGKRVGEFCPLTKEERRAYVEGGTVKAIKLIMKRRACKLREAHALVRQARGYRRHPNELYGKD